VGVETSSRNVLYKSEESPLARACDLATGIGSFLDKRMKVGQDFDDDIRGVSDDGLSFEEFDELMRTEEINRDLDLAACILREPGNQVY